ncbi:MAG: hypothetical protein JXA67_17670 [Micromonosporaceae bacterium]|nr:hypothetical protein [Micromonosporaceae bacterium]
MTTLATTVHLADRLHLASAEVDTGTAELALAHGSGLVRSIGRQEFSWVSQETVHLAGGGRVLRLPQRPVVVDGSNPLTVVEVGQFGAPDLPVVEGSDFCRLGAELTRGYPWYGTGTRLMGWPWARPTGVWAPVVRVTYSHGYATIPDDLVAIVLDVAAVLYDNPTSLRQISLGDYSETKASEVLGAALAESIAVKLGVAGRRRRAFSIRT